MADKDYTFDADYAQTPMQKLLYRGELFSIGVVVDSVATDGKVKFLFNARSEPLHVHPGWAFSGNGHVHAYEVTSWDGGSAINPTNNYTKYHSVNSISSLLIRDPTSINAQVGSDALWDQFIPGGTKSKASGGMGVPTEHFIIAPGTTIMIELENHSGSAATISFEGIVHETAIAELDDPE